MVRQIEIENLVFSYLDGEEDEKSLDGVNFVVDKGEFVGIIGKSGSGKSTLLKHLNGIFKADSGKVVVLDKVIERKTKDLKELRKKVGIVFQFSDDQLFSDTILEDILFAPTKFNIESSVIEKELESIKEIFKLDDCILRRNYRGLSGGERRRAAIASVVIMAPQILILDEPTIGLDYESKLSLMKSLKTLNSKGVTIIIVSHDLDTIWSDINRVVVMNKGKIDFDGTKTELLKKIDEFSTEYKFVPHYIEFLIEKKLLKGNEELAESREKVIEIIEKEYRGWKDAK